MASDSRPASGHPSTNPSFRHRRANMAPTTTGEEPGMAEIVERIGDADLPDYLVIVDDDPPGTWHQSNDRPGYAEWKVYEVAGVGAGGDWDGQLLFECAGGPSADRGVAAPVAEGSVKWDGCCDFHVAETEGGEIACLAHTCGPEDFGLLLDALRRAHELALEAVGGGLDG